MCMVLYVYCYESGMYVVDIGIDDVGFVIDYDEWWCIGVMFVL